MENRRQDDRRKPEMRYYILRQKTTTVMEIIAVFMNETDANEFVNAGSGHCRILAMPHNPHAV